MSGENSTAERRLRNPSRHELPPLVARTALSVIDEAVTLMRVSPGVFVVLTLVPLLPLRALSLLLPGSSLRGARPDQLIDALIGNLEAPGAVFAAIFTTAADSIALFVTTIGIGILLHDWYLGIEISAQDLAKRIMRRLPAALVAWTVIHMFEMFSLVAGMGVGALVVVPLFAVGAPILGIEQCGPIKAVRRSTTLTAGRLGHTMLTVGAVAFMSLVFRLVIRGVPAIFAMQAFELPAWISVGVADLVSACFTNLFVACAANVLYLNLRVRREGLDLQLLIERAFEPKSRGTSGREKLGLS